MSFLKSNRPIVMLNIHTQLYAYIDRRKHIIETNFFDMHKNVFKPKILDHKP